MKNIVFVLSVTMAFAFTQSVNASCNDVSRADLRAAMEAVIEGDTFAQDGDGDGEFTPNGGFDLPMWLVMVDETGVVCHVLNSGPGFTGVNSGKRVSGNSWLGSRVIAAQKANTANAFSVDYYAISTANLFATVQTNNSLFGLQESNPVDPTLAYRGNARRFGTNRDPMKGQRIGGINVFGGGLALYNGVKKIGAIGLSGDTSCTDHTIAWKIRSVLGLDQIALGITNAMFNADGTALGLGGVKGDEMYMDIANIGGPGAVGWEHAACPNTPNSGPELNDSAGNPAIIGTLP